MNNNFNKKKNKEYIHVVVTTITTIVSCLTLLNYTWNTGDFRPYFIILTLVIFSFVFYLMVEKFREIKSNNFWIYCDKFPQDDRICFKIREIINDEAYQQNISDSSFHNIRNKDNLYGEFLLLINSFISYAKLELKMTLPYSPYVQINDEDKYNTLINSLARINDTDIKLENKEKIIALDSRVELMRFKDALLEDIKLNWPNLRLFEYLDYHNNKVIIKWNVGTRNPIDEFIIIDNAADISTVEDMIKVDFNDKIIQVHKNRFENIGAKYKTSVFFKKFIFNREFVSKIQEYKDIDFMYFKTNLEQY